MDGDSRSTFGSILRELRLAAGLSQEALAERARVSAEGISVLERGARKAPHRETVSLLANGLGCSPHDRDRLAAAARRNEAQPRRRAREQPDSGDAAPRRGNLPRALTTFLGREVEIAELGGPLASPGLITLTGPGGVGKTRLALEAAATWCTPFADGVWFVDLAPIGDAELVARTVALTLDIAEVAQQPLDQTIAAALRAKRLMLVVDNCEHLAAGVAELAQVLLASCPHLRLIATSREPLRIAGEQRYPVTPLALPPDATALSFADVKTYAALALFVQRAGIADPSFCCTSDDLAPIADICRRLDGMPLAIELAAARTRLLSPAQIAARLDARFRLLTGGSRTALPRQQTLRAAIDWSYDLLDVPEQRLFRRLGVFAGRFGLAAATAVGGQDDEEEFALLDRLESLIDKSLVSATGAQAGEQRFRLLESMRLYARERLESAGESEPLQRRLANYVRTAAARVLADGDRDGVRWTERIEADLDNLRGVLEWSIVEGHDIVFGAQLVDELWRYWLDSGKNLEVRRLYDRILKRSTQLDDGLAGRTFLAHGLIATRRWDVVDGQKSLERALSLLRPLGEEYHVSRALNGLAIIHQELGDWQQAETLYAESLAILRRLDEPRALATVLMNLGTIAEMFRADYPRARELYLECLAVAREHGDSAQQAHVLQNLAELSIACNEEAPAIAYAQESLRLWRAHRNEEYAAICQVIIGTAELGRGGLEAARAILREALPGIVALHRGAALVSLFSGLAVIALADASDIAAAQLIGFAENSAESLHEHATAKARETFTTLVARARERTDVGVFDAYVRCGRLLTLDEAADLASGIAAR